MTPYRLLLGGGRTQGIGIKGGWVSRVYSPPQVDGMWFGVCYNKILIYSIFDLLKGDYRVKGASGRIKMASLI